MKVFSLLISTVPFFSSFSLSAAKQAEKMNVLFLMADDMRPELDVME